MKILKVQNVISCWYDRKKTFFYVVIIKYQILTFQFFNCWERQQCDGLWNLPYLHSWSWTAFKAWGLNYRILEVSNCATDTDENLCSFLWSSRGWSLTQRVPCVLCCLLNWEIALFSHFEDSLESCVSHMLQALTNYWLGNPCQKRD